MSLNSKLNIVFRAGCAMCFIGHGVFGIITKQVWCNYFAVFGIGEVVAYRLMPVVGIVDIVCGILFIVYPNRVVTVWLVIWGLFTALLRPLSGEPFAEFLERAGNYGVPAALLLLPASNDMADDKMKNVMWCLRLMAFTLLLGHGWLNLIGKAGLLKQYSSIRIGNPVLAAHVVGIIEIAGALMILIKPMRQIVLVFFLWKMVSEVLYPAYPLFEWIERGGSYAILLGLWLAMSSTRSTILSFSRFRTSLMT